MLPLAHIGSALVLAKAARASGPFAALGALAPDLVDKPLAWVLKVTPSGRYFGHSLLSCLLLSLPLLKFCGHSAGLGFSLGYVAHLRGDTEAPVPWLMPLVEYDIPEDHHFQLELSPRLVVQEALGLAVIAFFVARSRRENSRRATARG